MTRGSATTDHRFAYFTPEGSNSVYSYEWNTEQWNKLPSCPCPNCALVIIDGSLTTVGGFASHYTNKLYTLQQEHWVEEYPPMKNARCTPAVVTKSKGDCIIVIGGYGGDRVAATVELFQVNSRRWYELTSIPQPGYFPSATICDNQLHVTGWDDRGYTCSIESLPSSDESITSKSIPHLLSWTPLPHLPVLAATIATLCGQLVIIGGWKGASLVNSIHQLVNGKWVKIGSMSSARRMCLVVSPSPDRMMIVCGYGAKNSVEECVVVSKTVAS